MGKCLTCTADVLASDYIDCLLLFCWQDGDVIELCQVSDIRAGGLPKVGMSYAVHRWLLARGTQLDVPSRLGFGSRS